MLSSLFKLIKVLQVVNNTKCFFNDRIIYKNLYLLFIYFYLESPVKGSQNTPKKETKNEKCSKERIKPSNKPRSISRRNRSKVEDLLVNIIDLGL